MAMLIGIYNVSSVPANEEISHHGSKHHTQTEVGIIAHENEHEAIADENLQAVEKCLQQMHP